MPISGAESSFQHKIHLPETHSLVLATSNTELHTRRSLHWDCGGDEFAAGNSAGAVVLR
jgi:hypothetical protein